jgi:class 3 adenylate cyclase
MGIVNDLSSDVTQILRTRWQTRDGRVVPETNTVTMGNDAVNLEGTVLYADLAQSTELVQNKNPSFAAEIYKCYLRCASKIIEHYGGAITAFDGDRVMAVFISERKNTNAVRSALAINHAVTQIINPAIRAEYQGTDYVVRQSVGIDTSSLFVAKTGIRGANDLVWVGPAANIAAKLCELRVDSYYTWITEAVYNAMLDEVKLAPTGQNMWESRSWTPQGGRTVYCSSWYWAA